MRLTVVERGQRLPQKILMGLIRVVSRRRVPDIVRTMWYRPEFLGRPFSACMQAIMRGPSEWSVGERELFAAFISRLNQCPF
jgi:hypothetical protein